MADFDRSTLGNTFPIVHNKTNNPQFGYRTTPDGAKLKGETELRFYFVSGSENITNKASLTWSATGTEDVLFEANTAGNDGDNITITITENTADSALSVSVSGTDISIELADTTSTINSTVNEVINAVNNDIDASALVTASLAGGTGTATVTNTLATTNLDGGVNTSVDADLERINLRLRTENRATSTEEFVIDLPGPASTDITSTNTPYKNVNDYIADFLAGTLDADVESQTSQNTAGSALSSAGFDFSFVGSGNEGMWVVTIPGNTTDDQYTVNSPSSQTENVLPGGAVVVNVEVNSVDQFGNTYYWGDNDGTFDSIRSMFYYTPYRADLNDDGNMVDIFMAATSANTTEALDFGVVFDNMSGSEVVSSVEALYATPDATRNVTGDAAVTAIEGVVGAARVVADIPTIGTMSDRGVRVKVPTTSAAPADVAQEGEIRVDTTNDMLYVYSGGAWVSVGLT